MNERKQHNQSDLDDLIIKNIPLAYHIIHKEYPTYSKDEDVIQSAMVGLCKAANKFDPDRGKFSTYASRVIKSEIARELRLRRNDSQNVSLDTMLECGTVDF